MRKVIEKQLKIGQVDISRIQVDNNCRDEIPQLLLGLQAIYSDRSLKDEIFDILKNIIPKNVDTGNGRPGMDLWKILVLGTLRLNCNWDYDKLHNIANNHKDVREFLGHTIFEFDQTYALQTLKDNITLFTLEVLDRINQVVVKAGHRWFGSKKDASLHGRCDSFVGETDVHYPTDINLLWDAMRRIIELIAAMCAQASVTQWRQSGHILKNIKKLFNKANGLKSGRLHDNDKNVQRQAKRLAAYRNYTDTAEYYVAQVQETIGVMQQLGMGSVANIMAIEYFIGHAQRQIDQIRRRVLNGETIAHSAKVFSIFEPHTEWINKGKAGVSQELGLKVCVLEDQYGFILHHRVMEHQSDEQVGLAMVVEAQQRFANLRSCSFDKGFHSPANQQALGQALDAVILPRKGRLNQQVQAIEQSAGFVVARHQHAAVESAINALENHGLDRCSDHGLNGFKRYVALAVVARNLQILGAKLQAKARKRQRRRQAAEQRLKLAA